jgi:aldose 1-epimerase
MTLTGEQFEIAAGAHRATIVEVGAGLRAYACDGRDVTVRYPADELPPKACGAALVPWPNRIRDGRYRFDGVDYQLALTEPAKGNASHGLGRWERWTAVDRQPHSVTLSLDVVPQTGWPFELRAEITYSVDADAGLQVEAHARNTGTRRLPFGMGFHPYIDVRDVPMDDVSVRLRASERLVTDDASIPVGQVPVAGTEYDLADGRRLGPLRLDDGFTGLSRTDGVVTVTVATPSGDAAQVWFDESFRFTQVFTYEQLQPGVNGVAVEPMTCPANAFNSGDGLIVLDAGGQWSGRWGITPTGSAPAQ